MSGWREVIVGHLKIRAERGVFFGRSSGDDQIYLMSCKMVVRRRGVVLLYTRDVGHHSSGWWKNPDYENCYHLSLSFFDSVTGKPAPFRRGEAEVWVRLFFGDDRRLLWCEPPSSALGRDRQVHHYRLFCDPAWKPVKPRGEVYSRTLTEAGWKSFSELHDVGGTI